MHDAASQFPALGDRTTGKPHDPSHQAYKKLSVLMPIYNERWTLREIVARVLAAPVPLEIELVAVDDCSRDGSWEILQELAAAEPRIKPIRHPVNRGKGAAIRTAIAQMTGDVAVVQDADLEYDPQDYPLLLEPILQGKADAVFGSRFTGHTRRVLFFWHTLINKLLTLLSNVLNDLNLTDMETCYKMVRADILRHLRLRGDTFTFEPELTCRLAQWRARIYEVPVSYAGRTYQEGKKIRAVDGLKALWAMLYSRWIDRRFTDHQGLYAQSLLGKAARRSRWLLRQVDGYLGRRVLHVRSGIGNFSHLLPQRELLLLAEEDPLLASVLRQRFAHRGDVQVEPAGAALPERLKRRETQRLDTVLCTEFAADAGNAEQQIRGFFDVLEPGGHCLLVASGSGPSLQAVEEWVSAAGFESIEAREFDKLDTLGRAIAPSDAKGRAPSPTRLRWRDRLLPLYRVFDGLLPIPGGSLLLIARKPLRAAQRRAA